MMFRTVIVLAVVIYSMNAAVIVNVYDGQEPLNSEDSCNYQACDQLCRRLGFPGGACVGDRCKCDNFKQSPDTPSEVQHIEQPVRSSYEENEIPQELDDKSETDNDHQAEATPEANVISLASRGSCDCNARNCDFYCFRLHYTGGICVTGQCRCYK